MRKTSVSFVHSVFEKKKSDLSDLSEINLLNEFLRKAQALRKVLLISFLKEKPHASGAFLSISAKNHFQFLLIILPRLDLQVVLAHRTECLDECRSKTGVGDQWDVMVDSATTNLIAIGQLALGVVLRDVYDKVELMIVYHIHHIRNIAS